MRVRSCAVPRPRSGRAPSNEALIAAAVLAAVTASVSAQVQFDRLHKQALPVFRDVTHAVAFGDVDGDDDRDLVVADYGYDRLYLNDGTGIFSDFTAWLPPVSEASSCVALGDVDGDGDLDIAFGAARFGLDNRLYVNDGSGRFSDVTATHVPQDYNGTSEMAFGDVDGDGDLDLVCADLDVYYNNAQNTLYLNDGTGRFAFAPAGRMPSGLDCTTCVALGDVDADGDLDIVFGNSDYYGLSGTRQNQLYLNDGTGSFSRVTAERLPVDNDRTEAVQLGDVDGDGDLDLVLGNQGQNRLYLNDGTGRFADATSGRLPTDRDFTSSVALDDIDRDGDLDLALGNFGSWRAGEQSRVYLNDGSGRYADATATHMPVEFDRTRAVALGDVDGDGDLELVLGNGYRFVAQEQNRLYVNDGTGRYTDATATPLPERIESTKAVVLGDVDGDGDLDLVQGNYRWVKSGQNRLYLNDGTGTFGDAPATHMPQEQEDTSSVAIGDLDGDGDQDLVFGNGAQFSKLPNRLYLNDGTGRFADASELLPVANEYTYAVALGDVDGDGDLDLVIGNYGFASSGEQNRLYLNDGTARFTDVTASHLPVMTDKTTSLALGDLDGDGDLDLVAGNGSYFAAAQNRVYLNDGTGRFTEVTGLSVGEVRDFTFATSLGDLDGDGDLDLVFGNYPQNRVYLNDGRGIFADVTAASLPSLPNRWNGSVAMGDVDGDGDLDIVFGNRRDTQNLLLLNDGSATFRDVTGRLPVQDDDTRALVFGDVDGDGDLDLVVGNYDAGTNDPKPTELYLNLLRHVDAPLLARAGFPYRLDFYARHGVARPGDPTVPLLAIASANIPLPPFGTLFLAPSSLIALPPLSMPERGLASLSLTVPNVPSVVGVPLLAQALVIQPPVAFLTNRSGDVILR